MLCVPVRHPSFRTKLFSGRAYIRRARIFNRRPTLGPSSLSGPWGDHAFNVCQVGSFLEGELWARRWTGYRGVGGGCLSSKKACPRGPDKKPNLWTHWEVMGPGGTALTKFRGAGRTSATSESVINKTLLTVGRRSTRLGPSTAV